MLQTISPSDSERSAEALNEETVAQAAKHLRADGALILDDVVPLPLIERAREAFETRYAAHYLSADPRDDILKVGSKRFLVTIDLEAPFDDVALFANPFVFSILASALGKGFLLDAFGAVCSLPSAKLQHRHSDGGLLFPESGVDRVLPPTAVAVMIPLREMNETNGTTSLWLGTHRGDDNPTSDEKKVDPVVKKGSCVLWDYRLKHAGTANNSAYPRPLIYLTYCRPWWTDHLNYAEENPKQIALCARKECFDGLSKDHQRLLSKAKISSRV